MLPTSKSRGQSLRSDIGVRKTKNEGISPLLRRAFGPYFRVCAHTRHLKCTLLKNTLSKNTENFLFLNLLVSKIMCLVCAHTLTQIPWPPCCSLKVRAKMSAGVSNAVFHVFTRQRFASVAQFEF